MNKYIIVTTLCNKEEIANKIVDTLLNKQLVAGSQISKVHSKYWWDNKLEECDEYKLEFRTKSILFKEIEKEIKKVHDYEVAEISYSEIIDASKEFLEWIDDNIKRC
ncbi:MAG: divalent-cation tolerance protein CutA [Bacilli bacterium]|nr:divalent-cation tolerance protein CutA [Bacilli bacterium]